MFTAFKNVVYFEYIMTKAISVKGVTLTAAHLGSILILAMQAKGGFFSESAIRFLNLQISKKNIPKNYPELEI